MGVASVSTVVLWTLAAAVVVLVAVTLWRSVVQDGYGSRPGPRSHHQPWCPGAPCSCR